MDQQRHKLLFQTPAVCLGLTPSRRHCDDDVAQMSGSPIEPMRRSSLSRCESQNVCTAILMPEAAIELPHSPIADEREMHVCRRFTGKREDGLRQSEDPPASDSHRPDMYVKRNGH